MEGPGAGNSLHSEGANSFPFPETRWSLVRRAVAEGEPGAGEALNRLCGDYWYPLYAFARAQGTGHEEACDEIQGFFADLLKRRTLAKADPQKGRLRTFLLTTLKRFRAKAHRARGAAKRGGGIEHVSMDTDWGRRRFENEPARVEPPEQSLDRAWARLMVDRSIEALAAEFARRGQAEEFAVLVVFLEPGRGARSYAEAAARLGLSENNVKIRVYRMRARFRRLLEDRVRETLGAEPGELAEELRHLIRVLE